LVETGSFITLTGEQTIETTYSDDVFIIPIYDKYHIGARA